MAKRCAANRAKANAEVSAAELVYKYNTKAAIATVIGNPYEYAAYHTHINKRVRDNAAKMLNNAANNLYDSIIEDGRATNWEVDPFLKTMSLKDYLQYALNIPATEDISHFTNMHPARMIAVSKRLNYLVNTQRNSKKLTKQERAWMPVVLFGYKNDKFGIISDLMRATTMLTEQSRSAASPFNMKIDSFQAMMNTALQNIIYDNNGLITKDFMMDGVEIEIEKKTRGRRSVEPMVFLGSMKTKDGKIVHKMRDANGDIKYLQEWEITKDKLERAVFLKYWELLDDVLNLQAKNIKWMDSDPSKSEMDEFKRILKKNEDKVKLGWTAPEIGKIIVGDKILYYTTIRGKDNVLSGEETYNAYIIGESDLEGKNSKPYYHTSGKINYKTKDRILPSQHRNTFKDGFWKSNETDLFGPMISRYGKEIKGSNEKEFTNFKYMEIQPHRSIINTPNAFWNQAKGMRALFDKSFVDFKKLITQERFLNKRGIEIITKTYGKIFDDNATMHEELEDIMNFINATTGAHYSKSMNEIVTPNSYMNKKKSGYAPNMYRNQTVFQMLTQTIDELRLKYNDTVDTDLREKINKQIETLEEIRALLSDRNKLSDEMGAKLAMATKTAHFKHRTIWTDKTLRRKDPEVYKEYFNKNFRALYTNILLAKMLDTFGRLAKTSKDSSGKMDFFESGHIDYIINAVRKSVGNPSGHNAFKTIDKIDIALAKFVKRHDKNDGVEHNHSTAIKVATNLRGIMSAIVLGSSTGFVNRTQTVNDVIGGGWNYLFATMKEISGDKNGIWEAIFQYTGNAELVSAFMDTMSSDDVTLRDMGFLTVGNIPIPMSPFKDFLKLKYYNREKFIENGIPAIDDKLRRIEDDRIAGLNKGLLNVLKREEKRVSSIEKRRTIRELRKLYLDILTPTKGMTQKRWERLTKKQQAKEIAAMKAQIKNLVGDIAESRLKLMISWKLSWWFGQTKGTKLGRGLFTMSESERQMRKISTVMQLLIARDMGSIGASSETELIGYQDPKTGKYLEAEVPKMFLSPKAVRIARNTVRNTMFGMSKEHSGEFAYGLGSLFFQYKEYPIQQVIHDFERVKSFMQGNSNGYGGVQRLIKEAIRVTTEKKYHPLDPKVDHEARQMLRFVLTRAAASVLVMAIEQTSLLQGYLYRNTGIGYKILGTIRGGENIAISMVMRGILNALLLSFSDDDKNRKSALRWALYGVGFFVPAMVGYLAMALFKLSKGIFDLVSD